MIITFIYKINDNDTKYYGKYIGFMKTQYDEGLDIELRNKLFPILKSIKTEYEIENEENLLIGIIGFNRNSNDYFSENEYNIFDLLYCDWSNQPKEIYLNKKRYKL